MLGFSSIAAFGFSLLGFIAVGFGRFISIFAACGAIDVEMAAKELVMTKL